MILPFKQFAAYEKDYIRFYENTIKNGNSTKFHNSHKQLLAVLFLI